MHVLGIETSCDETSAAVVKNGSRLISNRVSSSLHLHKKYGGVVPEIASRMQLETITEVTDSALKSANLKLSDIGLISVTSNPGLLGSLLVGISFAKGVSAGQNIPLLGVNHLLAHIYAGFLQTGGTHRDAGVKQVKRIGLPFMGLVVSGGHTSLYYVEDFDRITLVGATLDDACGEAFDKVAKILGLGYPGGPLIERLAKKGDPKKIKFTCSNTGNPLDFSFSGIKTAVLYYLRDKKCAAGKCRKLKADIAASFQETAIDTIIAKSLAACKIKKVKDLVIGGGVVANSRLREKFYSAAGKNNLIVHFPRKELCLDNAAMVAGLGYILYKKGQRSGLDLDISSR